MARQLRLNLESEQAWSRADFVEGASNAAAVAAIDRWPNWHGGCMALVGPEGAGKTHLARSWAAAAAALILTPANSETGLDATGPVLIDDADGGMADEVLFHLINRAAAPGAGLLLTARTRPFSWESALPDLRSRLNALPVAEIGEPDDAVLEGALKNFFRTRSIRPPADIYPYLLRRIERSIPQAREIVRLLDETGGEEFRPISRMLAREVLDGKSQNIDVFEG